MRQAKATEGDLDCMKRFFDMLDEVMEHGTYTEPNDEIEEESIDVDAETLMAIIRNRWPEVGRSWRRVVFGCEILIENCCDPDKPYLELKPELQERANEAST